MRQVRSQKRAPGRRRRRRSPAQVLGDSGFRDLDAQFLEFAVNVWSAPQRIRVMHLSDQCSDVDRDWGPTKPSSRRTPAPLPGEEAAMPRDDRGRLHDLHGTSPAAPAWRSLLKDGELVAEGQNLRFKFGPRSEAGPNGCKESRDAGAHTDAPYQQRAPSSITTGSTEFLVRTGSILSSASHTRCYIRAILPTCSTRPSSRKNSVLQKLPTRKESESRSIPISRRRKGPDGVAITRRLRSLVRWPGHATHYRRRRACDSAATVTPNAVATDRYQPEPAVRSRWSFDIHWALQTKFAASLVLPVPLYVATCGYGQSGRPISTRSLVT